MPRPNKPHWFDQRGCFRTRIDGKFHYFPKSIGRYDKPLVADVPKAAWDYLSALLSEQTNREAAATDPTVTALVELFLQWAEAERDADRLSTGQLSSHGTHLGLFQSHVFEGKSVGDVKAKNLSPELADDFFEAMQAAEYSDHYVANVGKSVRAMLNWAARPVKGRTPSRLIHDSPLRGYQFPRPPGAVRGYVEGEVVRRFLRWSWGTARRRKTDALSRRFDRLFVLMLWFQRLTGCRPGEACDLRWNDIDWTAGRVVIPKERQKTGKKTRKARIIHLTPPVTRLLRVIERLPSHHAVWVFTHRRGNNAVDRGQGDALAGEPWPSGSAASAKVRTLREAAIDAKIKGIEGVGPRKLVAYINRHAYVSDAVSMGLTHEQAANLVGNTAAVVAKVYAHAIEDQDAERARKLVERGRGRTVTRPS